MGLFSPSLCFAVSFSLSIDLIWTANVCGGKNERMKVAELFIFFEPVSVEALSAF